MKKNRKLLTLLGIILCFGLFVASFSMFVSEARGNVQIDREASLALTYGHGDRFFGDLDIKIYRVASMTGNTVFDLDGAFHGLPVELNGIKNQGEWKEVASTLGGYIVSLGVEPTATAKTDANGVALFENMQTGLYLVKGLTLELQEGSYTFETFMITLPGVDENEEWLYDVSAIPKSSFDEKEEQDVDYRINKLWKDDRNESKRPTSVEIELYKDGALMETVVLSSENNWSYSWRSKEGSVWTAVEKNVPEGYTVIVEQKGTAFFVTNTYDVPPPPPGAGDESPIYLTVSLLSLAGAAFLILGLVRRRRVA